MNLSRTPLSALLGFALAVALTACGSDDKKAGDTQSVARVGSSELTVHQLNFALQQRGNIPAEQVERAGRDALERLIEQELAAQAAQKDGLDRDPRVIQALDAARRDILARAYVQKFERDEQAKAGKPSPEEVQKFFDGNPLLFAERRIYTIEQVAFDGPDAVKQAETLVAGKRSPQALADALTAAGVRPVMQSASYASESLPLEQLKRLPDLVGGKPLVIGRPGGASVLFVLGSTAAPLTLDQARSSIERFLTGDRVRRAMADGGKALRAATPVTYLGKFAAETSAGAGSAQPDAAGAASGAAPAALPAPVAAAPATPAPATQAPATQATTAPAPAAAEPAAPADPASAGSNAAFRKGLDALK